MRGLAKDEGGWALISTVGILLVLAVIAAGLVSLSVTSKRVSRTERSQLEAAAIMEAAVSRAIAGLLDPRVEERWRVDNVPRVFRFGAVDVTVHIQDELGLIDLNAADGDAFVRLLIMVGGIGPDAARDLADKIMDWREADDLGHLHGATKTDYLIAGYKYAPRQGPFQSVEELTLVMGMTPDVFKRIAPAITVHSQRPTFDPQVAPREALLTMPGMSPARVDETLQARLLGVRPAIGPSVYARPGVIDPSIPLGGRSFSITTTFNHRGGSYTGKATVMLTGDTRRPSLSKAWMID